jgi:hypothetical protein
MQPVWFPPPPVWLVSNVSEPGEVPPVVAVNNVILRVTPEGMTEPRFVQVSPHGALATSGTVGSTVSVVITQTATKAFAGSVAAAEE